MSITIGRQLELIEWCLESRRQIHSSRSSAARTEYCAITSMFLSRILCANDMQDIVARCHALAMVSQRWYALMSDLFFIDCVLGLFELFSALCFARSGNADQPRSGSDEIRRCLGGSGCVEMEGSRKAIQDMICSLSVQPSL
jgi:hypothetical protein